MVAGVRGSFCLFTSGVLHAAILGLLLMRSPLWAAKVPSQSTEAWLEVVPPPTPSTPPAEPPLPAPRPTFAAKPRPPGEPRRSTAPAVAPSPVFAVPDDAVGTLAISAGESEARPSQPHATDGSEQQAGPARVEQAHEPRRVPRGVELSLWIDRRAFEQRALVRPGLAIITAVPGLRDLLRGSNIRPLLDLERLRVTLHAPNAQELALAGVHLGGESAMRDAAKRIAAMRQQEPVWRGGSRLQATSWVDGSGIDRGLALHDGAFLIGARESMATLLGASDPAELSRMRERVFFTLALEDAARYLPTLSGCTLQALRISVASTNADTQRLSLRAEYESRAAAAASTDCVRALGERAAPLQRLVGWLEQASAESGSYITRLNVGVTGDELQTFLDELAWVLRSASRS